MKTLLINFTRNVKLFFKNNVLVLVGFMLIFLVILGGSMFWIGKNNNWFKKTENNEVIKSDESEDLNDQQDKEVKESDELVKYSTCPNIDYTLYDNYDGTRNVLYETLLVKSNGDKKHIFEGSYYDVEDFLSRAEIKDNTIFYVVKDSVYAYNIDKGFRIQIFNTCDTYRKYSDDISSDSCLTSHMAGEYTTLHIQSGEIFMRGLQEIHVQMIYLNLTFHHCLGSLVIMIMMNSNMLFLLVVCMWTGYMS